MDRHFDEHKVFHAQLLVGDLVEVKSKIPELSKGIKQLQVALDDVECKVSSINTSSDSDEKIQQLERKGDLQRER